MFVQFFLCTCVDTCINKLFFQNFPSQPHPPFEIILDPRLSSVLPDGRTGEQESVHNRYIHCCLCVLHFGILHVQSLMFCVYYRYNHCCFVCITCTIIAVSCILHVQSLLFCVYYMYTHCCFVYITGTITAVLCIFYLQALLF